MQINSQKADLWLIPNYAEKPKDERYKSNKKRERGNQ